MLPKKPSGVRYLPASAFNSYVTFMQPNAGQNTDGSVKDPTVVKQNVHANVSMWRGKEEDKSDDRVAITSYKIVIRYPKTYSLDAGMTVLLRDQLHNIESFADPDGQRVEMHIWTWVSNDTVNS